MSFVVFQLSVGRKGLSVKDIRSHGEMGVRPVRTFFGQGRRGSSDAGVRTFWCKNSEFFEIYRVSAQKGGRRGWASADKGGKSSIFGDFVRTSFMDSPNVVNYR